MSEPMTRERSHDICQTRMLTRLVVLYKRMKARRCNITFWLTIFKCLSFNEFFSMIFLLSFNFFLMETSGQHTTTDLVNFVYSPNGFVCSNRLHQGF